MTGPTMTAEELEVSAQIREAAQYLSGRRMRVSRTLSGLSGALYGLPLSYLIEQHRFAIGACAAVVRRAQRHDDAAARVERMREGLRYLENAITS